MSTLNISGPRLVWIDFILGAFRRRGVLGLAGGLFFFFTPGLILIVVLVNSEYPLLDANSFIL